MTSSATGRRISPTGGLAVDGMVAQPASLSLADLEAVSGEQPDHRGGLRRRLVVCRGVDRHAAVEVLNACGHLPQARYVVYFSIAAGLVGEHRHGRRAASADAARPRAMNDAELPVALRRSAAAAGAAPTRLQEREVHQPLDRHRLHEVVRQGPGLGIAGGWLRLVRGHLMWLGGQGTGSIKGDVL